MFYRLNESARRVIFYARTEASRLGGSALTAEHLLLGLLWEHAPLLEPLLADARTVNELRREIERAAASEEVKLPNSAEIPLAEPARTALNYASEESDRVNRATIDPPDLLLGLLRTRKSKAAAILTEFGLQLDEVRQRLAQEALSASREPFGGVACAFYGIEIRFDVAAEAAPRIIAAYQAHFASIEIDPVKVLQSHLPARAESMILEWATLRKDELIAAWKAAKAGKKIPPISPLE